MRLLLALLLTAGLAATDWVGDAQAPTTITWALWGGPGDAALARRQVEAFTAANPDVRVGIAVYPWGQYWAKLQTQCAAGLAPDVVSLFSRNAGVWAERGALRRLDDLIAADRLDLATFDPTAVAAFTWPSGQCAMPTEIAVRTLVYDQAKLEQAGIPRAEWPSATEPMAWDAFTALCRRLTLRGPDGKTVQWGMHYGYGLEWAAAQLRGGALVDRLVDPTAGTVRGDARVGQALGDYYRLCYADGWMLGRIPLAAGSSTGFDTALLSGRFAMGITGPWALAQLKDGGIRLGLAPLPRAGFDWQFVTVNGLGITTSARQPQAAWRFLRHMAGPAMQGEFGRRLRGVPALRAAAASIAANDLGIPGCEAFTAALAHARPEWVAGNAYVMPAIERWYDTLEAELAAEHDRRRQAAGTTPAELDALAVAMGREVDRQVGEALPRLADALDEAFERAKPVQPGAMVRIMLPIALVALFGGALIAFIAWARRRQQPQPAGLDRPAAGWVMLSPWLIGLIAFTLGPILAALWLSFCDWNMIAPARWVGLHHYLVMFADDRFWGSLGRTAAYAALVIPISLGGGLCTAALLTCEVRGRDAFKAILYVPSLFAGAASAVLWVEMFNREHGIVNRLLGWIGMAPISWLDAQHAFLTIVLMNLFWIGGAMIVLYAGMRQIPASLMEAAAVDGAGAWRRFISITIPMLSPILLFLVVTTTIGAFQVFTPALFVADSSAAIGAPGDSLRFFAVDIYDEAFNNLRMGPACARAVVLFALVFVITMLQMKLSRRWVHSNG